MFKKIYYRSKRILRTMQGKDLLRQVQVKVPIEKHGLSYGAWFICPRNVNAQSIVYSFGIGTDISFDTSLIEHYGCHVHAFDPTPRSLAWLQQQNLPHAFLFHPWGIASQDGTATFAAPLREDHVSYSMIRESRNVHECAVYRLQTIMSRLGHEHVDVLKMDIEGAEYEVLESLIASGLDVRQLLVEFHHRFEDVGAARTRDALRMLDDAGYRIAHISESGEEYSFLRLDFC